VSTTKGVIFYTDNRAPEEILSEVFSRITAAAYRFHMPITISTPETVGGVRSYPTMVRQIIYCLEHNSAENVFFCESDVLYPESHFEFSPPKKDVFYYNDHVWRWDYPNNRYITYNGLLSLSQLCVNREYALQHFKKRLEIIQGLGEEALRGREPKWARRMGYEPGTKKIRKGGVSDDEKETWHSQDPIIDVRHGKTFSPRKVNLSDFKHPPMGWRETNERP